MIGRYINLDRSQARRAAFEARLEALGVSDRYARFAAVDGAARRPHAPLKPGETGCFLSHHAALSEHLGAAHDVHMLEDDAVLAPQTVPILDQVIVDATSRSDLVFTDLSINFSLLLFIGMMEPLRRTGAFAEAQRHAFNGRRYPRSIEYVSLTGMTFAGTTSYIVGRASLAKVVALLEAEIERGPTMPIDIYYMHLVNSGQLSALCTVPFLTTVAPPTAAPSTIGDPPKAMDMVSFLMRSPFYLDRDDEMIRNLTNELTRGAREPDGFEPAVELMRYLFSDRFALPR